MHAIGRKSFDIDYMDMLAAGDSPLHRIDPRAKLITTLIFIVAVISYDKYTLAALTPFFLYPLVFIYAGGIPAGYILKKVLIVSPFAVCVGICNPLIDRDVLFHLGSVGISGGWASFISIMMRFMLTVSAVLSLVSVTGFNAVCESLLKLGVPKPLVVQLLFFNRYMLVLAHEAASMARARSLRTFNTGSMKLGGFVSLAGNLLVRTIDRAERIYQAMSCRGFNGHIPLIKPMRLGTRDMIFIAGWALLFVMLKRYNIPFIIGSAITGLYK